LILDLLTNLHYLHHRDPAGDDPADEEQIH
jgi:hypothetical protein